MDKFNWFWSNGLIISIGIGLVVDYIYGIVYGKIYFYNFVRIRSIYLKFFVYDFKNYNRLIVF